MGIVDQVMGSMMGGGDTTISGMQSMMMGLLGLGGAPGELAGNAPQPGGGVLGGGLRGLMGLFEQHGLGPIIQSWIGNGANEPVTADQLQHVFGENRVNTMAEQAGMPKQDFLANLAQHLPGLVDGMTPEGRLPAQA